MASAREASAPAPGEDDKLICVMGDEDTVTGFMLAGVGQRDAKGANFLVVDASAWHGGGVMAARRRRRRRGGGGGGSGDAARRRSGARRSPRRACIHSSSTACSHAPLPPPFPPPETAKETVEATFAGFLARGDVGLIIINQPVADSIRAAISAHTDKVPMVLEIPSAGGSAGAFDPKKDPVMRRVMQMLGEEA